MDGLARGPLLLGGPGRGPLPNPPPFKSGLGACLVDVVGKLQWKEAIAEAVRGNTIGRRRAHGGVGVVQHGRPAVDDARNHEFVEILNEQVVGEVRLSVAALVHR